MTDFEKEPSYEYWATDFLNVAHQELNKLASANRLTNDGNAARLLIGRALTLVERRPDKGTAPWPDTAIEDATEALRVLQFGKVRTFDQHRALEEPAAFCASAVRALRNSGRIFPIFQNAARDDPRRFFVRPARRDKFPTTDDPTSRALATLRQLKPGAGRQRQRKGDRDLDRGR